MVITGRLLTWHKWHDVMWRDMTWRDMTWRDVTWWRDATWRDVTWRDMTWRDMTWRDMTWRDVTWHDLTWHDMTWRDRHKTVASCAQVPVPSHPLCTLTLACSELRTSFSGRKCLATWRCVVSADLIRQLDCREVEQLSIERVTFLSLHLI